MRRLSISGAITRATLLIGVAATITAVVQAQGKTYLTVKQALALAFPKCQIERQTTILDKEQCKRIADLCGRPFKQRFVNPYVATRNGKLIGTAYFDNHKVRTLKQTLMVIVTANQKIGRIELLRFGEPPEYAARKKWLRQFDKKKLDRDLNLKRKIRGMTGASLTARATTDCARRILALHKVIAEHQRMRAQAAARDQKNASSRTTTARSIPAAPTSRPSRPPKKGQQPKSSAKKGPQC